jgi:3'-phosphoadenosine 5'-phosphosulfate (PAPS) 3'-phosphatase
VEEPLNAEDALAFSHRLADHARSLTLRYFRKSFDIDRKADESIVTTVDQQVENELRRLIREQFPSHGIIGEEYGRISGTSSWVLDPIDGTASLVLGNPLFGTLIGLLHADEAFIGLIDIPAMGERWAGDGKCTIFLMAPAAAPWRLPDVKPWARRDFILKCPIFHAPGRERSFTVSSDKQQPHILLVTAMRTAYSLPDTVIL